MPYRFLFFPVFAFCVLIFALTGCSSSHQAVQNAQEPHSGRIQSASRYPALKAAIDNLLPDSLFPPSTAGITIVDPGTGETLYELNPDVLLVPASNQKLFTSAASLALLGPQFVFRTVIGYDTTGTPTIYVKGGGDPLLTSAHIDTLAWLLSTSLPPNKSWVLAGDASLFDNLAWGKGWMWDDAADPDGMAISPLSVNGNTVKLSIRAGLTPLDTVAVEVDPATRYVTLDIRAITSVDTPRIPLEVTRPLDEQSNTIIITGEMQRLDSSDLRVSVFQPEWYMLTLLRERLEARGIACAGMVQDTVPSTSREVGGIWHSLDTVVTYMNRVSDNLSAECLLKTMGAARSGRPGSAAAGAAAVKAYLASLGLDTTRLVLADGSGVSRYDLVSARTLAGLLAAMTHDANHFPVFYNSLPVAGEPGTLTRRMRQTPAEHNLRGKTGTLRGVSSLSGYVRTADGTMLAYSMLMQNFAGELRPYRQVQDRIGALLSGWALQK